MWLMKKGSDIGQTAAETFVQWAKQEEELDNMTRSWERAMEQELSDFEESSDWMENVPSNPHQPLSPSFVGSSETKPTVPAEFPTGLEARNEN